MLPTLAPGDRVLVCRWPRVRAGDVAVVRDPHRPVRLLVKRVESVGAAGVVVVGDNPGASRDSRAFGPVPLDRVVGRAWYRYVPAASAGILRRATTGRLPPGGDGRRGVGPR